MRRLSVIALAAVLFCGCNQLDLFDDDDDLPLRQSARLGQLVQVPVRTSVVYPDAGLKLQFNDLADSRCPEDVQCVWAGQVEALFTLSGVDKGTQVLTVTGFVDGEIDPEEADRQQAIRAGAQGYRLTLYGAAPYPNTRVSPPGPPTVLLSLDRVL